MAFQSVSTVYITVQWQHIEQSLVIEVKWDPCSMEYFRAFTILLQVRSVNRQIVVVVRPSGSSFTIMMGLWPSYYFSLFLFSIRTCDLLELVYVKCIVLRMLYWFRTTSHMLGLYFFLLFWIPVLILGRVCTRRAGRAGVFWNRYRSAGPGSPFPPKHFARPIQKHNSQNLDECPLLPLSATSCVAVTCIKNPYEKIEKWQRNRSTKKYKGREG